MSPSPWSQQPLSRRCVLPPSRLLPPLPSPHPPQSSASHCVFLFSITHTSGCDISIPALCVPPNITIPLESAALVSQVHNPSHCCELFNSEDRPSSKSF